MVLGTQLHISLAQELIEQIAPVENDEDMPMRKKPKSTTGLWTSSWREETQDSDWVEWCRGENFGDPDKDQWFLLTPRIDARIYMIDSLTDLERLLIQYEWYSPLAKKIARTVGREHARYYTSIDFERLSKEYDALHLTEYGNGQLHLSYPLDLNAWDSESTIWFHWCFTEVRKIQLALK